MEEEYTRIRICYTAGTPVFCT